MKCIVEGNTVILGIGKDRKVLQEGSEVDVPEEVAKSNKYLKPVSGKK